MDKSLDEIITTSKSSRGRRNPRRHSAGHAARSQVLGNPTPSPAQRARVAASHAPAKTAATAATTQPGTQQPSDKIFVSNLPLDVNEAQIKELFHSTIGPLRDVTLHYDAGGRSKGVASVHFSRRGDGNRAYQSYNNRLIDGKSPMKIEIVVDPARPAPLSLAARVAPAPAAAAAVPAATTTRRAASGARGRRGRGRGGARKTNERPAKSAADLDAEMEDYTSSNQPAGTATATA